MILERIKLKLRFRTNIRSHLRWFEFLFSPKFYEDIKRRVEAVANVRRLRKLVEEVIENEIYNVSSDSLRTGNLRRSITGVAGTQDDVAGNTVYFDPSIAAAKGPIDGGSPPPLNYAAFFDRPEFNSFILGTGLDVFNPLKYRPFREPMTLAFQVEGERQSIEAIARSILSKRPRQVKVEGSE